MCDSFAARLDELASIGKVLYEDRLKGIIAIDSFKRLYESVGEERASIKAEHDQLSQLLASEERRVLNINLLIPKLREFLSFETPTHDILAELIDCITVSESEGQG